MFNAAAERRKATVEPVPAGTETLSMMLFRRVNEAVVAVASAVCKTPEVLKFAPTDDAFR